MGLRLDPRRGHAMQRTCRDDDVPGRAEMNGIGAADYTEDSTRCRPIASRPEGSRDEPYRPETPNGADGGAGILVRASRRLRVAVADGHPGFRRILEDTIRSWPEFELVTVDAGEDLLSDLLRRDLDVLIADPATVGVSAEELIEQTGTCPRVLFISHQPRPADLRAALDAGAAGYLAKDAPEREVCDAVLAIARGRNVIGDSVQLAFATAIRLDARMPKALLSDREREIVRLIAEHGMTVEEIADRLILSPATIKTHLHHVHTRFGSRERGQLIFTLVQLGELECPVQPAGAAGLD